MRKRDVSFCRKAGLFFLFVTVFIIVNAWFGKSIIETDATPIFITLPLGIALCRVSKHTKLPNWED